jgi:hypothetical protein
MTSKLFFAGLLVMSAFSGLSQAQDVRYYEKDGLTYAETTRKIQRPITETHMEEKNRTVYRQECRTEMQETLRTYQVPVTEWRTESYWVGRWNPFVQPYLAQRMVPHTRWETKTETVKVPVVRQQVVAENRVERVPVYRRRMIEEEQVSRVAIGRAPSAGDPFARNAPAVARRERVGGVSKLESDPPRQGGDSGWRPVEIRRR